ncbi:hypothetical protein DPEC_G00306800 [Dallia pectoralis]|uniref:Uncharacterized protein n=1 Tax=Dallia pectoralis TaxID=75939 RepID=A0ACC2FE95_DALPE|nr:hypothetical protein DPEC_G00306800 [Dallia pectoralis]
MTDRGRQPYALSLKDLVLAKRHFGGSGAILAAGTSFRGDVSSACGDILTRAWWGHSFGRRLNHFISFTTGRALKGHLSCPQQKKDQLWRLAERRMLRGDRQKKKH